MEKRLLIIDGSSMLSTSYYATLPPSIKFGKLTDEELEKEYKFLLQTSEGIYTNGVYAMFKTFMKIVKKLEPSHVVITWDVTRKTFRQEMFKDYKAGRRPTPPPLKQQFKTAQKFFEDIGVCQLYDSQYEADDLAGSVAKQFAKEFDKVYIVTKDQDYLQLVDDNIVMLLGVAANKREEYLGRINSHSNFWDLTRNIPEGYFPFTPETLLEIYKLTPNQIIDWKAIAGDSSDNIPGIKGIGSETAVLLLSEFKTLRKIQEFALSDISDKEFFEKCKSLGIKRSPRKALLSDINGEHLGRLSYQLAKIKTDITLSKTLQDIEWVDDPVVIQAGCRELEFNIDKGL